MTPSSHADSLGHIEAVVRALRIHPDGSFTWLGRRYRPLPARLARGLPPETVSQHLLHALSYHLYYNFYGLGGLTPTSRESAGQAAFPGASLLEQLSGANSGDGCLDHGWQKVTDHAGGALVARRGLALLVGSDEYSPDTLVSPAGPAAVRVRMPKELRAISPGFYMALGNAGFTDADEAQLVRLYWNVTPPGAVSLMGLLSRELNACNLPFKLKVISDPSAFSRCDIAVLYIRKQDFHSVGPIARDVYWRIAAQTRPATPPFTKRLAPGLALAEDPGKGESFGMHRCTHLAAALLRAHQANIRHTQAQVASIAVSFAQGGMDIEKPFLRPGSKDIYDLEIVQQNIAGSEIASWQPNEQPGHESELFLEIARSIGDRLAATALWHGEHCNWIGPVTMAGKTEWTPRASSEPVQGALGPDLYGGTSGIGLYLAELGAVTADPAHRRTALGALRQALARVEESPGANLLGFHTGSLGVLVAATRGGLLLGDEELVTRSERLLRVACEHINGHDATSSTDGGHDLVSGSAGAIVALLALYRSMGDDFLLATAGRLGDRLLGGAQESRYGCFWEAHWGGRRLGLTGFAHGASGIAYALLELYSVMGDGRYREAAVSAFSYERHWFDAVEGNWADLRFSGNPRAKKQSHFSSHWCHGAPGIALARAQAYKILARPEYKEEAEAALRTTMRSITSARADSLAEMCLCHGVAGNAEVLKLAGSMLEPGSYAVSNTASQVAPHLAARLSASDPTLAFSRTDGAPGLMTGLAGIGLFFLREYNPATPSALGMYLGT